MPVSIHRIDRLDNDSERALMRILKDIPADHALSSRFQEWQNSPDNSKVWFAKFNDRFGAAALIRGDEIEAFVVHPATRRRGMAKRMIQLLLRENPGLTIDVTASKEAEWLGALIQQFSLDA